MNNGGTRRHEGQLLTPIRDPPTATRRSTCTAMAVGERLTRFERVVVARPATVPPREGGGQLLDQLHRDHLVSRLVHFSARVRAASWPLTTAFTVGGTTDCFTDCLLSVSAMRLPRLRGVPGRWRWRRGRRARWRQGFSLNWRAVVATVSLSITCRPPPAAGRGSGRPGGRGDSGRPGAAT